MNAKKLEKKLKLYILCPNYRWCKKLVIISERSTIVVTKDQVSADLSGEAAILNLKTSTYFGLNTVGASIWKLLQEPKTVSQIRDAIIQEYDVEPDRCEHDILELLHELSTHGLIEIIGEKK